MVLGAILAESQDSGSSDPEGRLAPPESLVFPGTAGNDGKQLFSSAGRVRPDHDIIRVEIVRSDHPEG